MLALNRSAGELVSVLRRKRGDRLGKVRPAAKVLDLLEQPLLAGLGDSFLGRQRGNRHVSKSYTHPTAFRMQHATKQFRTIMIVVSMGG